MNAKHTPGPWHRNIPPASKYVTIFAGRNTHVCHLANGLPDEEMEGNCNLIAAAPELLSQLKALVVQIEASGRLVVPPGVTAAIAKAEGHD